MCVACGPRQFCAYAALTGSAPPSGVARKICISLAAGGIEAGGHLLDSKRLAPGSESSTTTTYPQTLRLVELPAGHLVGSHATVRSESSRRCACGRLALVVHADKLAALPDHSGWARSPGTALAPEARPDCGSPHGFVHRHHARTAEPQIVPQRQPSAVHLTRLSGPAQLLVESPYTYPTYTCCTSRYEAPASASASRTAFAAI